MNFNDTFSSQSQDKGNANNAKDSPQVPESTQNLENMIDRLANAGPTDLWQASIDVWQHGFMGVDIAQILLALGIFAAFLFLRGIITRYVLVRIRALAEKSTTSFDDKLIDALTPPIRLIPIILGLFFAIQVVDINQSLQFFFQNIIRSLVVFTLFWGIARALTPLGFISRRLERLLSAMLVEWIFKVIRVLVYFIGGAVILEIWGIEVGPLLAGFGLLGAAVALGAQDMFKNLIAGITIIAEKRFHPGDWIRVESVVEGIIEEIGFRSTKVRRFDKAPVHVPNAQLSDAAIINFSRMTHRRIYWVIGVEYRTNVDQLKIICDGIMNYINQNDDFDKEVSTFVRVDSFGTSSIDIMLYCFTRTTIWGEWLAIKEQLALQVKNVVEEEAGAAFAFPSQSIYVESFPTDAPEIFLKPEGDKKKD